MCCSWTIRETLTSDQMLLGETKYILCHSGGQVVSMLAFHSNNPSSNPPDAYSFFCKKLCLKRSKLCKKRPGLVHFLKKQIFFYFSKLWPSPPWSARRNACATSSRSVAPTARRTTMNASSSLPPARSSQRRIWSRCPTESARSSEVRQLKRTVTRFCEISPLWQKFNFFTVYF